MITRRAEYKRKRWYKRRAARRNPMDRTLKGLFREFRASMVALFNQKTPLLSIIRKAGDGPSMHWGGDGMYFDVVASPYGISSVPTDNYAGHVVEAEVHRDHADAVPVHSGDSGRAPTSAGGSC